MTEPAGSDTPIRWYLRHVADVYRPLDHPFRAALHLNVRRHDQVRVQALPKAYATVATHSGRRL